MGFSQTVNQNIENFNQTKPLLTVWLRFFGFNLVSQFGLIKPFIIKKLINNYQNTQVTIMSKHSKIKILKAKPHALMYSSNLI